MFDSILLTLTTSFKSAPTFLESIKCLLAHLNRVEIDMWCIQ